MRRRVELNEETDSFDKIKEDILKRKRFERKLRNSKRFKRFSKIGLVVLAFFLIYKFDSWEGSRLDNIVIKGNNLLSNSEVQELSKLEKNNRIYFSFGKLIQNKIEQSPLIQSASVEVFRKERTILINVLEEEAIAYENQPEVNIYFKNGEKISISEENIHGIEGLILLSNIADDEFKKEIVLQLAELNEGSSLAISEILHKSEKHDEQALKLVMNHGYYVYSNLETLPLLDNYATIISGANPENKCIHLLEYGPTEDTQVATVKPCDVEQIENDEEE